MGEIEGSDNEQETPPEQNRTPEPETKKSAAQETLEEAIIQRAVPEQNQRPEPKPKEASHKFGDDQTEAHVTVEPDKEQKTVPAQNQVESESKEALHKFEDEEPQEIEGSDNEQTTPLEQNRTPEPETKK